MLQKECGLGPTGWAPRHFLSRPDPRSPQGYFYLRTPCSSHCRLTDIELTPDMAFCVGHGSVLRCQGHFHSLTAGRKRRSVALSNALKAPCSRQQGPREKAGPRGAPALRTHVCTRLQKHFVLTWGYEPRVVSRQTPRHGPTNNGDQQYVKLLATPSDHPKRSKDPITRDETGSNLSPVPAVRGLCLPPSPVTEGRVASICFPTRPPRRSLERGRAGRSSRYHSPPAMERALPCTS